MSLLGHMSFASKVIGPRRSFMSFLLQLTKGVNNKHYIVYLNDDCKQDLKMWKNPTEFEWSFIFYR